MTRQLVYNAPMDIPTAILYAILANVVENTAEPVTSFPPIDEVAMPRSLPVEAKTGRMLPPAGDGFLIIGGRQLPMAPAAQIRNRQNLIVIPMQVQDPVEVVYVTDASGAVSRVWMLTPNEASASRSR